jgi:uncharacterized protein GlcG (DUF336 family)
MKKNIDFTKTAQVVRQTAGALALFSALSSVQAQLLPHKDLSAMLAISIVQTAITTCKANGYSVSATVVGRNGEILAQARGDNTGPHTLENSFRKAYTARTFKVASGEIVNRLKMDPAFPLIHLSNIIANQGGLPIKLEEDVMGAVGVSGAPGGDKDEACSKAGIDKVSDYLK